MGSSALCLLLGCVLNGCVALRVAPMVGRRSSALSRCVSISLPRKDSSEPLGTTHSSVSTAHSPICSEGGGRVEERRAACGERAATGGEGRRAAAARA